MTGSKQRRSERWIAACPASFEVERRQGVGFVRDLSERGALLFVEGPVPLGGRVDVWMHLSGEHPPVRAHGRVVRAARRDRACSYPWRYSVAVEFERPIDGSHARTIGGEGRGALVGPA